MSLTELSSLIADANRRQVVIYCFEITLRSKQKLLLNSGVNTINLDNKEYHPYSGLELKQVVYDDSAQNYAIISGIYEEGGITKEYGLLDAEVKVSILLQNGTHTLFTYICRENIINDLDFVIKAEPEIYKYNAQAVKLFSKTCRANLGDIKCKVNLVSLTKEYIIKSISGKEITLESIKEPSGYFTGGKVIIELENPQNFGFLIISHFNDKIIVADNLNNECLTAKKIKLLPGCDKKFITCCKKFDNALNFRGEPFVPETHILEN